MAFPGCNLPLVHSVCQAVGGAAGGIAKTVVGGIFDQVVKTMWDGLGQAIKLCLTWWTKVPSPKLSDSSGPVGDLRGALLWITVALAVSSLLICAGKMAFTRSGRHAAHAGRTLGLLVAVTALTVPAVVLLDNFFGSFATWIIDRSAGGNLGQRLGEISAALGPVGSGMAFLLAIVGILSSVIQLGLMFVRVAVLVMLTGAMPMFAAASGSKHGMHALDKALAWLIAFLLYKPAAAVVYSCAFFMVGDGKDAVMVVGGLTLMALAVLALPALLRLLIPVVAHATEGVGAGRNASSAAGTVANGAKHVSNIKGMGSGSKPPMSGGGGKGAAPTGSGAAGPAGAAKAGSAAGAASKAHPVAAVAVGAAQKASEVAGKAAASVDNSTGGQQ